jgi:hypothetical protein
VTAPTTTTASTGGAGQVLRRIYALTPCCPSCHSLDTTRTGRDRAGIPRERRLCRGCGTAWWQAPVAEELAGEDGSHLHLLDPAST